LLRSKPGAVALFSHGYFLRTLAICWLGLSVSDGRKFVLDSGAMSLLGFETEDGGVPAGRYGNTGVPLRLPPE
jgi:broad specificity phosphatase PhoE